MRIHEGVLMKIKSQIYDDISILSLNNWPLKWRTLVDLINIAIVHMAPHDWLPLDGDDLTAQRGGVARERERERTEKV